MTTERRKYFRVQDIALVKYRVIQSELLEQERRSVCLSQVKVEHARATLFGLETHLREVFEKIRHNDPMMVEAMELINRKINLLERVISLENTRLEADEHLEHQPQEINLSGGGMAIAAERPLDIGTYLAIDLILLPDNDPMRIFGKVIDSRTDEGGQYHLSIAFDEIREEDQDRLVQHVLRRQAEDLRSSRQASG